MKNEDIIKKVQARNFDLLCALSAGAEEDVKAMLVSSICTEEEADELCYTKEEYNCNDFIIYENDNTLVFDYKGHTFTIQVLTNVLDNKSLEVYQVVYIPDLKNNFVGKFTILDCSWSSVLLPCAGDMVNELVQNAVKTFCCNMEW